MRPPKTHWFARDCGTLVTFVFTVPCINFCKYILYILRHRYRTNGTKQQTCLKISKQLWRRLVGQQLWLVQFSVPGAHLSVCFDYLPWPHLTSPSHGLLQDTGICKVPPLQTQVYAKCHLYRHKNSHNSTQTHARSTAIIPDEPGLANFLSILRYILSHHVLQRQVKWWWQRKRSEEKIHSKRGNWCTFYSQMSPLQLPPSGTLYLITFIYAIAFLLLSNI